jgi:hypothetical protein
MSPDNNPYSNFFSGMPSWVRGIVLAMSVVPLSFAVSGQFLGVRVGDYLDRYVEIQFEQMQRVTDNSADKVIEAVSEQVGEIEERLADTSNRVERLEGWACSGGRTGRPDFCKGIKQ